MMSLLPHLLHLLQISIPDLVSGAFQPESGSGPSRGDGGATRRRSMPNSIGRPPPAISMRGAPELSTTSSAHVRPLGPSAARPLCPVDSTIPAVPFRHSPHGRSPNHSLLALWGTTEPRSQSAVGCLGALHLIIFKTLRVHRPPIPVLTGRGEDGSKTG